MNIIHLRNTHFEVVSDTILHVTQSYELPPLLRIKCVWKLRLNNYTIK